MKIAELINELEKYAPVERALDNERVGFITGNGEDEIKKVVITMSLTEDVIDNSIKSGTNMIVCYEPLEFNDISFSNIEGRLISRLIKSDIALYVMHTNLDVTDNGYSAALLEKLEVTDLEIIKITYREKCYKLASCVPVEEENWTEQIRKALGEIGVADGPSGAGYIGTYSEVSDYSVAYQWFRTMPGANPHIGAIGDLSKVQVERFEMIIPEHQLDECIDKLCKIHPYEEVEYDVYPLEETRNHMGKGRTGRLENEMPVKNFVEMLVESEGIKTMRISCKMKENIGKVSVCTDIDDSMVDEIIKSAPDVLITDAISLKYTVRFQESGIGIILLETYDIKKVVLDKLKDFIYELGLEASINAENIFMTFEDLMEEKEIKKIS